MKGFISLIVIIAIFLVAIIMVNIDYQRNETISFKEEMLDAKLLVTNYELALNRAMIGENLMTAEIDGNSEAILNIIVPTFTKCDSTIVSRLENKAEISLHCFTNIIMKDRTVFSNEFSKTIIIDS
jgi:hypothetical protein